MKSNISKPSSKSVSALNLYLVTDADMCGHKGLIDTVCAAIDGGVTMVQLRDKYASDDVLYHTACQLKEAIGGRVPLLINDRVSIAKKAGLDGAHIGQGDIPVLEARSLLGADAWLGLTINTIEQLQAAQHEHFERLNYVGLGPVFATNTKANHELPIGINGLKELVQLSTLPTVAIGGIHLNNAAQVYATGCNGIAVVSEICGSNNPKVAAQALLKTK